jgi:hypothetical protein
MLADANRLAGIDKLADNHERKPAVAQSPATPISGQKPSLQRAPADFSAIGVVVPFHSIGASAMRAKPVRHATSRIANHIMKLSIGHDLHDCALGGGVFDIAGRGRGEEVGHQPFKPFFRRQASGAELLPNPELDVCILLGRHHPNTPCLR